MEKYEEARLMAIEALTTAPHPSLFQDPIEYLFADHFRQRTLCRVLDEIADDEVIDAEKIEAALAFLKTEFGPHVLDEEEDLYPMMRRRAEPEDDIGSVLGKLSKEHATDETDANAIVEELTTLLSAPAEHKKSSGFRDLLKRFAENERRHLILENAIVFPLAKARLTERDLLNLGKRMAARRGISYPEAPDAN